VADGERDPAVAAGLGQLDAQVARRALGALRGEEDVFAELWPVMHLGMALAHLAAVATGSGPVDAITGDHLDGFRADPALTPLAPVLEQLLAGSRSPALAARLELPAHRAMVLAVLRYVGEIEGA
jgi:hypothetical protein